MENEQITTKIEGQGNYSAIAEYLYENQLIPHFGRWVEEQKNKIKIKAEEKGYSPKKLQYIIYISIDEDGTIWGDMEGYETEHWINNFPCHRLYSRYDYVTKTGWDKEHQMSIYRLFQEVEIHDLRRQNKELVSKLKK